MSRIEAVDPTIGMEDLQTGAIGLEKPCRGSCCQVDSHHNGWRNAGRDRAERDVKPRGAVHACTPQGLLPPPVGGRTHGLHHEWQAFPQPAGSCARKRCTSGKWLPRLAQYRYQTCHPAIVAVTRQNLDMHRYQ